MTHHEVNLYDFPIEQLGLSLSSQNQCLKQGLTSVGDCVDIAKSILFPEVYLHLVSFRLDNAMNNEVIPAIIEQGFLKQKLTQKDFDPEIIEEIKQKLAEKDIAWRKQNACI